MRAAPRLLGFALHFTLYAATLREGLTWDGISFLHQVGRYGFRDFAHFLYPVALDLSQLAASPWGVPAETAAKLLSALAASVAFAALWGLLEDLGTRPLAAAAGAALCATAPPWWEQGVTVEVYAPALALLLLGARAALSSGRGGRLGTLILAWALLVAAATFHIAAVLAAPWYLALARREGHGGARRHLLAGALALLPVLGLGALLHLGWRDVEAFLTYARAFLSAHGEGRSPVVLLQDHGARLWLFLSRELPVLTAAGVAGLVLRSVLWRRQGGTRLRGPESTTGSLLWLAVPYLVLFLVLGVPLLGLLLPVLPALALAAARGAAALPRWGTALLAGAVLFQAHGAFAARWEAATGPDPLKERARLLAAALPPSSAIMSRHAALHLSWYFQVPVVALNEVAHHARAQGGGTAHLLAAVRESIRHQARRGRRTWITAHGLRYLREQGIPDAELRALLVEPEVSRAAGPDDPRLVLRLLRARPP